MHIGVVTTGYPHRGAPIAGCFVRAMCAALARRGHRVTVLCAARPRDTPLEDDGVEVVPLAYALDRTFYAAGAPDNLRAAPFASLLGGAHYTATLLAEARRRLHACDALISHFALPAGLIAALVRDGRPHLAVVHGSDGWLLARAPAALRDLVLHGATHVQFTHRALADALPTRTATTVRPMGVDLPPDARTPRDTPKMVLMVGRLVAVKRVHLAVHLAARLNTPDRPIFMVIAGDGPLRAALESLAQRLGAPVRFVGAVSPAERDAWMARASLLLHTAGPLPDGRTEGAPVVLLEAMASGLACLATDAGGAREMLADAGAVVSIDELDASARALLDDDARRAAMGAAGRARAAGLSWPREAERIEALLTIGPARAVGHSSG